MNKPKKHNSISGICKAQCSTCGVCVGMCPMEAISLKRDLSGDYRVSVDEERCTACGLCRKICPYYARKVTVDISDNCGYVGEYRYKCIAVTKNEKLRKKATSGGIASTVIEKLIETGAYDLAFCVKGYGCNERLVTHKIEAVDGKVDLSNTYQSRYMSVSQEEVVKYIRKNRKKKIIITGIGCAIEAISYAIEELRLERNNYLLLGMFCSGVLRNKFLSVVGSFVHGELNEIQFRNKDRKEWHGVIKLTDIYGNEKYLSQQQRIRVKSYLTPKRCLLCQDYYCFFSDISLGDSNDDAFPEVVVVRTHRGEHAMSAIKDEIEELPISDTSFFNVHSPKRILMAEHYCKLRHTFPLLYIRRDAKMDSKICKNVIKQGLKQFAGKICPSCLLAWLMKRGV